MKRFDQFWLLISSFGADMETKWQICISKLALTCDHLEGENGQILSLKVFLSVDREQYISRNQSCK